MKMQALPVRAQMLSGRGIVMTASDSIDARSHQLTVASGIEAIRRAVPFNIDNVTEYLFAGTDKEHWSLVDDFPILTPPFEEMWFETHGPSNVLSNDVPERYRDIEDILDVRATSKAMMSLRWGVLWTSKKAITSPLEGEFRAYRDEVARARRIGAEWVVTATLTLLQPNGQVIFPAAVHRFLVLPNGRAQDEGIVYVPSAIVETFEVPGFSPDQIERMAIDAMSANFFPTYLAVSFCHCKNIFREENLPSRAERRAEERAGRIPVKYYTLKLQPMRTVNAPGERSDGESGTRTTALHIVRGHFATYTQEKPLFGRVVGTFWKPMHVRGEITHGLIVKDYAINAPKED